MRQKCKPGNKPCGDRCIKKSWVCKYDQANESKSDSRSKPTPESNFSPVAYYFQLTGQYEDPDDVWEKFAERIGMEKFLQFEAATQPMPNRLTVRSKQDIELYRVMFGTSKNYACQTAKMEEDLPNQEIRLSYPNKHKYADIEGYKC